MEPSIRRGDLLILSNRKQRIEAGEIVVYKLRKAQTPIVHRVVRAHGKTDGGMHAMTKGDNNVGDDSGIYKQAGKHRLWLDRDMIVGHSILYLPYVGKPTVVLNDYPLLKAVVIAILAVLALIAGDS